MSAEDLSSSSTPEVDGICLFVFQVVFTQGRSGEVRSIEYSISI